MKKIFISISILVLCLKSFSQSNIQKLFSDDEKLKIAQEYYFKGNLDSSLYFYEQFDSTHPLYNEIAIFKNELYWENKNYEKLITQTEQIYSRIDKTSELYERLLYRYGIAYIQQNEYVKAISILEEGYTKTMNNIYLLSLINTWNLIGQYDKVISYDTTLISTMNESADYIHNIYFELGVAYYYSGNFKKSEFYLIKSDALNKINYDTLSKCKVLLIMGIISGNGGNKKLANRYYKKSKVLLNKNIDYYNEPKIVYLENELKKILKK